MTNFFLESPDDDEITETEQKMREREIRERYRYAKARETIPAMIKRYKDYGQPI